MTSLTDWFDSRTGYRHLMREVLLEPIPGGARWRYVWGSTLVFTFTVQVITGLFLWTAYSPSAQTAWESVYFIQDVMSYGWLVRGILLLFDPTHRTFYSVLAVLSAAATWLTSNLGGFVLGMFLGIIGGSLAFGWSDAPRPSAGTPGYSK